MKIERKPLLYSLAAHIVLVLLLVVALDMPRLDLGGQKKVDTIETLIVDAPILTTSEKNQIRDERVRRQEEVRRKEKEALEQKKRIEEEKRKKEEARRKLEAEQKRKQEAERKRKEEEVRKAEALKKKKAEEEARKKAEEEKKRKEEAERKRKEEEEARKKAEAEAKKKAEAEARRKAQEALEAQMAAEMAAEEEARRRAAEEAALREQLKPVLARWVAAMRNKVARNWLRPPGGDAYFECSVFVKQLPSGEVLDVRIEESCGSDVLNESVRKAVLKASPLPLPEDMRVFKKELIFVFKPD